MFRNRHAMHVTLRTSIMVAVISGLLIPVSISTLLTLRQQERVLESQFLSDHLRLATLLAQGMQDPLWNLSVSAASPLFDAVLSDERVVSVLVADNKAGIFLSREHPERRRAKQMTLERDVVHEDGGAIGRLSIEMDTERLDSAVTNYRRIFMATVAGQLMLSLLLIVTLLQVRVLAPINRLMQEADRLAHRDLEAPFEWQRRDEIGRLGRTLEGTRVALRDLFDELEAKNLALKEDIGRRMQIENELKRHQNQLEELVSQRTAVLARRSEELARSNAELEQMAYVASHDLNEPLRMIVSYLQLIERRYLGRLDDEADEFIGYAVDGAKRMQALISDLLAYSRIGQRHTATVPVDCSTVVAAVARSLGVAIEESGARVTWGRLPVVMADPTQMSQLFQNLLSNALKYRGSATPEIHVDSETCHGYWHFYVRDNGIGIPSHYAERVFEMFQRLHGRNDYPGTGIGLAICKKIVERQGGRIWVEANPNPTGGSVFHFTIAAPKGGAE